MNETNQFDVWATEIADTIRSKTKKTEPIPATKFSNEIANIPSLSDLEINNAMYLFFGDARINIINELLSICKNLTSSYQMFYNAYSVDIPIDLSHGELDSITSNNNFSSMFYGAKLIPSIKLSSSSTSPTTLEGMFFGCEKAESIDINGLNTSKVTNMNNLFRNCNNLKNLKFDKLDTSNVQYMSSLFYNCYSLEEIPEGFTSFNFKKLYSTSSISALFYGCKSMKELDISSVEMPTITSLNSVFYNCSSAKLIKLPIVNNKVTDISYMLHGCDNLSNVDLSPLNNSTLYNITSLFGSDSTIVNIEGKLDVDLSSLNMSATPSIQYLCKNNKCLRSIKLPNLSNSKLNNSQMFYQMFKDASSLVSVEIGSIKDTTPIVSLAEMFSGCIRLKTIKGLDNITKGGATFTTSATNVSYSFYRMFYNCESLETIDLSGINTKNLSNTSAIKEMFRGCKSLKTLNISHFIINSRISDVIDLFNGCESLVTLSLPDFTPATSITNTSRMFNDCKSLKTINNLDTLPWTKITDYRYMFYNSGLTKITLPIPATTPTNRDYIAMYMFANSENLVEVDARMFGPNSNTSNSMKYMFANCPKLTTVDLSNCYISSWWYGGLEGLFQNCTSLKNVKLHNVKGEYIGGTNNYMYGISYMFEGCSSLEVLDLRYLVKDCVQMGYGIRLFAECRKLRKLDLRGGGYGTLGASSSAWAGGVKETFLNCGVDNDKPTTVYVDTVSKQINIIGVAKRCGLNWSTENVIVVEDPETPVDMS